MRYLILALILTLTTACAKDHIYEVGDCFYVDESKETFYKIVNIDAYGNYSVRFMTTEAPQVPEEYRVLADSLPLPFKVKFKKFEAYNLNLVDCPR